MICKIFFEGYSLENKFSIVLEDHRILSDICGSNDSNLKLIEKLLDTEVYTNGNELFLTTSDSAKREIFSVIVDKMKDYVKRGGIPGSDFIKCIFAGYTDKESNADNDIENLELLIPGSSRKVFPRSVNQVSLIKKFNSYDLVFATGPAGTGKTYLAIAKALSEILQKKKRKLIITRPVVEAGESLGFLPGDLIQKISPYLHPLYDAIESMLPYETIVKMEETKMIEIAPLAYMRGRSLSDSFIILDEAQNTTKEQMKMFLTRIGEGSKAVITGDITQIDLPNKKQSGLIHALNTLKHIDEIGFTFFTSEDVMRNPLVKKIIDAYEKEK
jgi:phosphate starvation-inducible PhoH-like protein